MSLPRRSVALGAFVVSMATWGCNDAQPRRTRAASAPTKSRIYGDPGLVPTRAGERARAELALSSDLEGAVRALPSVQHAKATIRIENAEVAGAVLVVQTASGSVQDTERASRLIAGQVLGPAGAANLVIETYDAAPLDQPPTPPAQGFRWPLLVAILGLGFSVGVLFDRTRRRARRPRRRS